MTGSGEGPRRGLTAHLPRGSRVVRGARYKAGVTVADRGGTARGE